MFKKFKFIIGKLILGLILGIFFGIPLTFGAEDTVTDTDSFDLSICEDEATSEHFYVNETGPSSGKEYWARVYKFRIYLHDDFMNNVDLDTLECSSGGNWYDCNATNNRSTSTADGGTTITYVTGDTSSDAVYENYVQWEYGTSTTSDSPIIPGYNDYDGDGTIDTSDEDDRSMGEYLTFDFKTDDLSGSATTTSGVYIKFWEYDQNSGTWTAIAESSGGETDKHWNNHTVEGTINYSCECEALTIDSPTFIGSDELYGDIDIEISATYDGKDVTEQIGNFEYSSETFSGGSSSSTWNDNNGTTGTGSIETGQDNATYTNSEPGETISVTSVEFPSCSDTIELPYCADLSITDPGEGNLGAQESPFNQDVLVEAEDSNGENWPWNLEYDSNDSDATFDGNSSTYVTDDLTVKYESDIASRVDVKAQDDVAGFCSASFSYSLEEEKLDCANLTIDTPSAIFVADIENDVNIEISAHNSSGADITSTIGDFTYSATDYSGSTASGEFEDSSTSTGNTLITNDSTVTYSDGLPADTITVTSVDFPSCTDTIEFPYCTALDLIDPNSSPVVNSSGATSFEQNIEIEVEASNSEDWPFDVTYKSTDSTANFDDDAGETGNPITTNEWELDYTASTLDSTETVTIETDLDVYGYCTNDFAYLVELACVDLVIDQTDPISEADMDAGNVEISWVSTLTNSSESTGSFKATAYDSDGNISSGEFTDASGASLGTGSVVTSDSEIFYTGTAGDSIQIVDITYPSCKDTISSDSSEEQFACVDLTIGGPYLTDGTLIDDSDQTDLELLYDETTSCFAFDINVEDVAYSNTLFAEGWDSTDQSGLTGTITIDVNETGDTDTGNEASVVLTGFENYTGSICLENFDENSYLYAYMLNEELTCEDDYEFPPIDEEPVCTALELDPNSYTMTADESDAGTINLTVYVEGETSSWSGTLTLSSTGEGVLFYDDGSASEFSDGHLEIPVSGTDTTALASYVGGQSEDEVEAYIENEETACSDNFNINQEQETEGPICTYIDLDIDEETQCIEITVDGSDDDWCGNLVIETTGDFEVDDDSAELCGIESSFSTCYSGEEGTIDAYIEDEENSCSVDYEAEQVLACIDLSFDLDNISGLEGEDATINLDLNSELEDQTLVVQYYCEDEEGGIAVEYNGVGISGSGALEIDNLDGGENFEVTFEDLCNDAEISAYIEDEENLCYDDLTTEVLKLGDFSEYIFTFNFTVEKNAYSDENIFFSHDEDRAFYTLEYDPAGGEEDITFTDDMWDENLLGYLGGGEQKGNISLATSADELTSGRQYEYSTIVNFGFGDTYELYSDNLADYVSDQFNSGNYISFVPYIKYGDDSPSDVIKECEYDEDNNLETEEVCYDPEVTPEDDGEVRIENAGYVEDLDANATIRIRYVGVVDSDGFDCSNADDDCLTLEFQNNAALKVYDGIDELEAEAKLVVLCSYLVTRNAGDVFLEVNLDGGSDIACIFADEDSSTSSDYRNVDALVILEDGSDLEEDAENLDFTSSYSGETISICDNDEYSENLIGNLSSYVCEIITEVSDLWKSESIEDTTDSKVSQSTRNAETNQAGATNMQFTCWNDLYNTLYNRNNPNSGILYYEGSGDTITLGGGSSATCDTNKIIVDQGAWTIIVKDATLVIANDILYEATEDYNNIPSVAFIVNNGDIHVNNTAGELNGVYYTDSKFTADERSPVDEQLTVYGSLYGNIQELLKAAEYVGSPNLDGGGLVIYYDSRILLNTPPGLSEYVDIETEEALN